MPNSSLKLVTVNLQRTTRLTLLVPADVDNDAVAAAVEYYFDGSTMYGGGEENDAGDAVLRGDDLVENNACVAESEPAEQVESGTARAVTAYWNWALARMEKSA
jgi:hypothetical protein